MKGNNGEIWIIVKNKKGIKCWVKNETINLDEMLKKKKLTSEKDIDKIYDLLEKKTINSKIYYHL